MSSIAVDDSRYPLVVVRFEGAPSDVDFDAYLARLGGYLERRQTTATILDARAATLTTAKQRQKQADWIKKYAPLLRAHSAGTAFVITSGLVRGMLTAILWLQSMPQEHVVVATPEEAEAWTIEKLRARGATVPQRAG